MFVKVVRRVSEEALPDAPELAHETLYECDGYYVQPLDSDRFIIHIGTDSMRSEELEKSPDNSVYIMNDNGRTIDHYNWN